MSIRVFIVGYEKECEKSFFCKTGGFGEWLTTRMSREFQSPSNRMARLYFLSYSDPAILTLQLPACFTRMTLLTSQSRVLVVRILLNAHTWSILHILSHTTLTLFPHKYRVSNLVFDLWLYILFWCFFFSFYFLFLSRKRWFHSHTLSLSLSLSLSLYIYIYIVYSFLMNHCIFVYNTILG